MHGSALMKLTVDAAIDVCLRAARHGLVVVRVEGGIWHAPGFEATVDCIWDGTEPPVDDSAAHRNNLEAAEFIARERFIHTAFVVTAPPISGWPHKSSAGRTQSAALLHLLSSIATQLNDAGHNYTAFFDVKVQARGEPRDPCEYVRAAFGRDAVVDATEATTGAVAIETIERSIIYAGWEGAGPSRDTLESEGFCLLVRQLIEEVSKVIAASEAVLVFHLGEGHPAYPVFWDFGFLFMLPDAVLVLIGSSSD